MQLDKMLLRKQIQVKAIIQIVQKCCTLRSVSALCSAVQGVTCASVPETVLAQGLQAQVRDAKSSYTCAHV